MKKLMIALLVPILSMYFVTIDDFNKLENRVAELETIEVNQVITNYDNCNLIEMLVDEQKARENGYTFIISDEGLLIEYKDGIPTGDIFTEEDLQKEYCEVINNE